MPTAVRQEALLGEGSWVQTIETGGDYGILKSTLCFLRVGWGATAPALAIVARWECMSTVT